MTLTGGSGVRKLAPTAVFHLLKVAVGMREAEQDEANVKLSRYGAEHPRMTSDASRRQFRRSPPPRSALPFCWERLPPQHRAAGTALAGRNSPSGTAGTG